MTVDEILEQAKALPLHERQALMKRLVDTFDERQSRTDEPQAKTGAEIVAMLEAMDSPIELIYPEIEDSVEWVKQLRRDERERRLGPYLRGEQ